MKIRNLMVLLLLGACAVAAFAGGQQGGTRPASTVSPGETAGFEEFPLGDDFELGPLNVAGVYFQPVDMIPASAGLPASQSDMHLEADISAGENDLGYGVGDFVPNLTVQYEIIKTSTSERVEGTFMPMNASDGPHYGANVKLPGSGGPGEYTVRFLIQNPEAQGYVLHVDQTTGVPGRFWGAPLVAEWTLTYAGPAW
ncbi:MAG: iron transporter [Treponema sp.]|jgi:uncharacterized protein involved in high-affinity Fe2+ transport|nr:iron transporter [Treponema sp.]